MEQTGQSQGIGNAIWQQMNRTTNAVVQGVSTIHTFFNTSPLPAAIKNIALLQFLCSTQGNITSSLLLAAELPAIMTNLPELTSNTARTCVRACVFTKNMGLKLLVKAAVYYFPEKLPSHVANLFAVINENPARKKALEDITPTLVENYCRYRMGLPLEISQETMQKLAVIAQPVCQYFANNNEEFSSSITQYLNLAANALSNDAICKSAAEIGLPLLQLLLDYQANRELKISPENLQKLLRIGGQACVHMQGVETTTEPEKNKFKFIAEILNDEVTIQQLAEELAPLCEKLLTVKRNEQAAIASNQNYSIQSIINLINHPDQFSFDSCINSLNFISHLIDQETSAAIWPHLPKLAIIMLDALERKVGEQPFVEALRNEIRVIAWPAEPQTNLKIFAQTSPIFLQAWVTHEKDFQELTTAISSFLEEKGIDLSHWVLTSHMAHAVQQLQANPEKLRTLHTLSQQFAGLILEGTMLPSDSIAAFIDICLEDLHQFNAYELNRIQANQPTLLQVALNDIPELTAPSLVNFARALTNLALCCRLAFKVKAPGLDKFLQQEILPVLIASNHKPFVSPVKLDQIPAADQARLEAAYNDFKDHKSMLINPNLFLSIPFLVYYASNTLAQMFAQIDQARNAVEDSPEFLGNIFKELESFLLHLSSENPKHVKFIKNSIKLLQQEVNTPLLFPSLKLLFEDIGKVAIDSNYRLSEEELTQIAEMLFAVRTRTNLPSALISKEQCKEAIAILCHEIIPHLIQESTAARVPDSLADPKQIAASLDLMGLLIQTVAKLYNDPESLLMAEEYHNATHRNLFFGELNLQNFNKFSQSCLDVAQLKLRNAKPHIEDLAKELYKSTLEEFLKGDLPTSFTNQASSAATRLSSEDNTTLIVKRKEQLKETLNELMDAFNISDKEKMVYRDIWNALFLQRLPKVMQLREEHNKPAEWVIGYLLEFLEKSAEKHSLARPEQKETYTKFKHLCLHGLLHALASADLPLRDNLESIFAVGGHDFLFGRLPPSSEAARDSEELEKEFTDLKDKEYAQEAVQGAIAELQDALAKIHGDNLESILPETMQKTAEIYCRIVQKSTDLNPLQKAVANGDLEMLDAPAEQDLGKQVFEMATSPKLVKKLLGIHKAQQAAGDCVIS